MPDFQTARAQDARLVLHGREIANLQDIVREAHSILSGAKNDAYLKGMAERLLALPVYKPRLMHDSDVKAMRKELAELRAAKLEAELNVLPTEVGGVEVPVTWPVEDGPAVVDEYADDESEYVA